MPTKFFDDLTKLDAGVAAAYKQATNDDPAFLGTPAYQPQGAKGKIKELTPALTKIIFDKILHDGGFTAKELEALLFITNNVHQTKASADFVDAQLLAARNGGALIKGNSTQLKGPTDLKDVLNAVKDTTVTDVSFLSPKTGIFYTPNHYLAVRKLIEDGAISVVRWNDVAGIKADDREFVCSCRVTDKAGYASAANQLSLYGSSKPEDLIPEVVHEATHAIQDWLDVEKENMYMECDAYIAQAVIYKTLRDPLKPGQSTPVGVAYDVAADLVRSGNAKSLNKPWTDAYDKVLAAVTKDPRYTATNNMKYPSKDARERKAPEQKRMQDLVNGFQKRSTKP